MGLDCGRVRGNLLFYLEGEEHDLPSSMMKEHLENCPRCSEKARSIATLSRLLSSMPRKPLPELPEMKSASIVPMITKLSRVKLPAGFQHTVLDAVRKDRRKETAAERGSLWRMMRPAAAAAVIIVILSASGYRFMGAQTSISNRFGLNVSFDKSFYYHSLEHGQSGSSRAPGNRDVNKGGSASDK